MKKGDQDQLIRVAETMADGSPVNPKRERMANEDPTDRLKRLPSKGRIVTGFPQTKDTQTPEVTYRFN